MLLGVGQAEGKTSNAENLDEYVAAFDSVRMRLDGRELQLGRRQQATGRNQVHR
jgi:hypothetical protein